MFTSGHAAQFGVHGWFNTGIGIQLLNHILMQPISPGVQIIQGTYSGETSQTVYEAYIGVPYLNVRLSNDSNFLNIHPPEFPNATGDDFRSGAAQINIFGFSIGSNIFTGARRDADKTNINGQDYYTKSPTGKDDPDKYRAGVLYLGWGYFRIGVNSEEYRADIQNGIHEATNDPYFTELDIKPTFYFYFGTGSGGTLW